MVDELKVWLKHFALRRYVLGTRGLVCCPVSQLLLERFKRSGAVERVVYTCIWGEDEWRYGMWACGCVLWLYARVYVEFHWDVLCRQGVLYLCTSYKPCRLFFCFQVLESSNLATRSEELVVVLKSWNSSLAARLCDISMSDMSFFWLNEIKTERDLCYVETLSAFATEARM